MPTANRCELCAFFVDADLRCGQKGMKVSSPQKKCLTGKFRLKAMGLPKAPEPSHYAPRVVKPVVIHTVKPPTKPIIQPPPGPNKPAEGVKKVVIPAAKKGRKKKK